MLRLLPLLLALASCARAPDVEPLLVFAAASTVDAVQVVARRYEADGHGPVRCSFAASSALARQIVAGADADIYLSADAAWMDDLERRGLLLAGTRSNLLGNRLAWIAPRGRGFPLAIAAGETPPALVGRIAVADPEHVPAGRYAEAALRRLGWWETLRPRLVPAGDVRAALRLVETGAVESGLVYATDAAASDRVEVLALIPAELHPSLVYPVAVTAGARPGARRLLEYLRGPEAAAVFAEAGFTVPGPEPS